MATSKRKRLPLGVSDFRWVITENGYFVDKTLLIGKLLDNVFPGGAILFTRPRRFGKSLAISMLNRFFNCNGREENRPLFNDFAIAQSEEYMAEQGKYPVISLDFKSVKADSREAAEQQLYSVLFKALLPFAYLLDSDNLLPAEKEYLHQLLFRQVGLAELSTSYDFVCAALAKHHGQPVIILIDEYDTPLQAAYQYGFYQPICDVLRNFFCSALKGNTHLRLGVITGVLRIAKESLFSGLNNLEVDTILSEDYANCFGFTQSEVNALAQYYGAETKVGELKEWYDGYRFGEQDIYNPWSVLEYFKNKCTAQAYWLDTSSNDLTKEFLRRAADVERQQVFDLYNGGSVKATLNTSVTYPQLQTSNIDILFSLLAVSGYLKPIEHLPNGDYRLVIPNKEIKDVYATEILSYIEERIDMEDLVRLRRAITDGEEQTFADLLRQYMVASLSFYDTVEAFYHGWMMGMLLCMKSSYECLSNREAGLGRADVILLPRPRCPGPGLVFEFKHCEQPSQMPEQAQKALQQIEDKNYVAAFPPEVREVLAYGMAFCQKECFIAPVRRMRG